MEESFYKGIENNFRRALKFIAKHNLSEKFKTNAKNCLELVSVCGYSFHEEMCEVFMEVYGEEG